jgi:hypothetical protein
MSNFNHIHSVVDQRLFLLNLLRKQGLSDKAREIVFQDLITSRLTYAIHLLLLASCPAYILSVIILLFVKSVKWGIVDRMSDAETLISDAEIRLFGRFKDNSEHRLNQLLLEIHIV